MAAGGPHLWQIVAVDGSRVQVDDLAAVLDDRVEGKAVQKVGGAAGTATGRLCVLTVNRVNHPRVHRR